MMVMRIMEHVRAINPMTDRKRVFPFMADKVTELNRARDAFALIVMSEE